MQSPASKAPLQWIQPTYPPEMTAPGKTGGISPLSPNRLLRINQPTMQLGTVQQVIGQRTAPLDFL